MKSYLRLTIIGALAVAVVMGQGSDSPFPVHGEVTSVPPGIGTLTVELSPNGDGHSQNVVVNPDGTFDFRRVTPGSYELRVLAAGDTVLDQETVIVSTPWQSLSIRIPDSTSTSRHGEDIISARQLIHKVPIEARKAFEKGERAKTKGNPQMAAELFRQAVSIDPEFADAFNELGAVEAEHGDLPQAIKSFQKAIDVVPEHRLALANLSIVLAKSGRYEDAAAVARRALKFTPGSGILHYVLASSLLVKGESDEVLDHLERSTSEVPFAHLLAAQILAHRGQRLEAMHHVEDYLRTAPSDDKQRNRAEAMLAQLRP
jgi:tetratricopeptide (TPR) repeat protein